MSPPLCIRSAVNLAKIVMPRSHLKNAFTEAVHQTGSPSIMRSYDFNLEQPPPPPGNGVSLDPGKEQILVWQVCSPWDSVSDKLSGEVYLMGLWISLAIARLLGTLVSLRGWPTHTSTDLYCVLVLCLSAPHRESPESPNPGNISVSDTEAQLGTGSSPCSQCSEKVLFPPSSRSQRWLWR